MSSISNKESAGNREILYKNLFYNAELFTCRFPELSAALGLDSEIGIKQFAERIPESYYLEEAKLKEKDKKIFSGKFAESEINEMNKQQENGIEVKQKKNYLPIIIISSVTIILIIGGVLYIKKLREDD